MMDESKKITIISDFISYEEIKAALNETDIILIKLSNDEEVRSGLDPVVLSAFINGAVTIFSTLITLVVTLVLAKHKNSKTEGLLIIKNEQAEIHIPFNATDEEIEKKIELIKKMNGVEQVLITKTKDG